MDKRHHPFWKRNDNFKYIYCFGLGVMSMGHMKSITETQEAFERLLSWIYLPEEKRQQIFIDLNNHFERRVEEVFTHVRTKEEQYCFVLDLYHFLGMTSWAREYCSQVLEYYLQVFQFSAVERIFFQEFANARKGLDVEQAIRAYQCFVEEGYSIRYDFLTWFYPEFLIEEEFQQILVPAGKTVVLDKTTKVNGDIVVERGGSLLIQGAAVEIKGGIRVSGGRIQIDHGDIQVLSCTQPYWLQLEDTAVVTIIDTQIDCHGNCGVLQQNTGRLLVEDSWFRNTYNGPAVSFSGQSVRLIHTRFWKGEGGGIVLGGAAHARIQKCEFQDCSSEYGGAISSDSIEEVVVMQCSFLRCRAKYLGGAVYFKHQKLGHLVQDCQQSECEPKDSVYFNLL